ncbi:sugar-transfer associated ATP-grasp domain-containing protein [Amaricoccus sp.]|uniref:sugar-transfer associated ATP-grasp domain-containing protein n=1 Tax=Amaricoccus sp. TaxID=1872485 RepID=UPI001B4003EF|nr:sugar-transfer associated ATP-grasp domain-containing protein [Amaricoccus sp.]MBP7002002.1 hypothetical protein [Amaricoccus sp.]
MRSPAGFKGPYKRLVNRTRDKSRAKAFQLWVESDVDRHMARLLATGDVRPLPEREVRRIRDYARDVFGDAAWSPWLHFYAVWNGSFREGWVPEDYFQSVAIPFLNGAYHKICQARTLQRRLLGDASMPDIGYFVGGEWFDVSGARVSRGCVPGMLFGEAANEVCLKAEHTIWGRGVTFETRESFDLDRVERQGNFAVQQVIRQAEWFDPLSPAAVATIRVATGKVAGAAPQLVGAFVRLGFGDARAIGKDSVEVPILDAAGTLAPFAVDDDWRRIPRHPETGQAFDGLVLPEYPRIIGHCLALHDRLPQFGFIGWDAVLDASGAVKVMEFNTAHPETRLIEMALGPCFGAFGLERYKEMTRKDVWS